jgi:ABC-2 type transport system permease protein
MNKTLLVARREFLTRVQKKTFLLTTIGVPLLIAVFYAALIFFQFKSTDTYVIALSDEANVFEGKVPGKKDDLEFKLPQPSASNWTIKPMMLISIFRLPSA